MLAKVGSVALLGAEARLVEVEVYVAKGGLPCFRIVGLPAKSIREAEQRTRSAIESTGEKWPGLRMVANLAPAALRKEGTHFDLALALGVLAGQERISSAALEGCVVVGELGLDGAVRPVPGALAAALTTRDAGLTGFICPAANAQEAAIVEGLRLIPVGTLGECVAFLRGRWEPEPIKTLPPQPLFVPEDLAEVRGQGPARRALEIAASGGHNLLLQGPPGSGKTMLARRLPGILPTMSDEEALEVTRVHSIAGMLEENSGLIRARPFRMPHHNISLAGLIGGGQGLARPGEACLAHFGVLFLDELALYRTDALDALRQPLEDGWVRIVRSGGSLCFPCRFSLIAAMNPCPCGYQGDARRECRCDDYQIRRYLARVSGPFMDRVDMQVDMKRLTKTELLSSQEGESSAEVRARVEKARRVQAERYGSPRLTNAAASKAFLDRPDLLDDEARAELGMAIDNLELSGRGITRVLRVARTIADLADAPRIEAEHVSEAIGYRLIDTRVEAAA